MPLVDAFKQYKKKYGNLFKFCIPSVRISIKKKTTMGNEPSALKNNYVHCNNFIYCASKDGQWFCLLIAFEKMRKTASVCVYIYIDYVYMHLIMFFI